MSYDKQARWPEYARAYVALINEFLEGKIDATDYSNRVQNPAIVGDHQSNDDPIHVLKIQLVHDANHFYARADEADEDCMSAEELAHRAGFARDALVVTIAYWEHINK